MRGTSKSNEIGDKFFARTSSATKDPGVVGPLVWNLRRQALSTEGISHVFITMQNHLLIVITVKYLLL